MGCILWTFHRKLTVLQFILSIFFNSYSSLSIRTSMNHTCPSEYKKTRHITSPSISQKIKCSPQASDVLLAACKQIELLLQSYHSYKLLFGHENGPSSASLNSSPPGQTGHHFRNDICKCIFVKEMSYILIRISLKLVPKGPIDNKSALVWVMAWRRTGDKPLLGPMLTQFTDAYLWH